MYRVLKGYFTIIVILTNYCISVAQPATVDELELISQGDHSYEEQVDIAADLAYNYVWGDAARAYEYAEAGIKLADSIGYEFGRAKCFSEAGLALLYMGYGPEALEYLFEATEILNKYNDHFWKFTTLSSIGYVYWELNEHMSSLEYFKSAKPFTDTMGIYNFRISILSDIGETYIKLHEIDSGLKYVEQSYEISINTFDTFQIAVTANQLATLYRMSGDLEKSYYYAKQSLHHSDRAVWNPRRTYLNIAEIFWEKGELDSCINYAHTCVSLAKSGSFLDEFLLDGLTLLSKSYEALNMHDSMVYYLREQIETNAIIVDKEKTKRIQGIVFERQLSETRVEQAKKEAVLKTNLKRQRLVSKVVFGVILLVTAFVVILINRYRLIRRQKRLIQKEKERGDKLLLNILPEKIADELKYKGNVKAVHYDEVAILFTDFVDFTKLSSRWSAEYLVNEIDQCFSAFDEIIYRHGLEKIKTIGDAYMAACGVPNPEPEYSKKAISAALDILDYMEKRNQTQLQNGEETFRLRIGIHAGPAVAGVVGIKKFAYDVWGDTVNIASRMESNGEPGKVNISDSIFQKVKANPVFNFTNRPHIEVKGKGSMKMYFVEHSKSFVAIKEEVT